MLEIAGQVDSISRISSEILTDSMACVSSDPIRFHSAKVDFGFQPIYTAKSEIHLTYKQFRYLETESDRKVEQFWPG